MIVFGAILIFTSFCQLIAAIEAKIHKNTIQTIAVTGLHWISIMCASLQISQLADLKRCSQAFTSTLTGIKVQSLRNTSHPAYAVLMNIDAACGFRTLQARQMPDVKKIPAIAKDIRQNLSEIDVINFFAIFLLIFIIFIALVSLKTMYGCISEYGWSMFKSQGADVGTKRLINRFHLLLLSSKITNYLFACTFAVHVAGEAIARKYTEDLFRIDQDGPKLIGVMVLFLIYATFNYFAGYFAFKTANVIWISLMVLSNATYYAYVIFVIIQNTNEDSRKKLDFMLPWLSTFLTLSAISLMLYSMLSLHLARKYSCRIQDLICKVVGIQVAPKRFSI